MRVFDKILNFYFDIHYTGIGMSHQCYYCDQMFDSKEKLFDHLEVHSDTKESPEKKPRAK